MQLRNITYSGFVLLNLPNYVSNIFHHVIVDTPSKSGSIDELIFCTNLVQNLGCSYKLLKNLNTAFWAVTYTVVWFATRYIRLHRVSISKWNAHLSIFLNNTSAFENIKFACDRTVSTLLKHAYITLPYVSTLHTSELTNYILTLTLVIPSSLQFD